MAVKFYNITENEFLSKKFIYKYMTLEYAFDTLENNHLWFSNPCNWHDPFESRVIQNKYQIGTKLTEFPWKNRVFCMCMTENPTCEAYWTTYSKQDIGISFEIKRAELLDKLKNYSNKKGEQYIRLP